MKHSEEIIQQHMDKADKVAMEHLRSLVRGVLNQNSTLVKFIMGMGTYFFVDRNGENVSTMVDHFPAPNFNLIIKDERCSFKKLNDFMCTWDHILKLSGESVTIQRIAQENKIT